MSDDADWTLPPQGPSLDWSSDLVCSAATHPGTRRRDNQDACLSRPDLGLWAVADGAGGHLAGEAASLAIITALDAIPRGLSGAALLAEVRQRLSGVHATLRTEAAGLGSHVVIASTVVVLIVRHGHFACLWAGDSRAYRIDAAGMEMLTRDHSLVQEMVDAGALEDSDAEDHPQANVITRAVGDASGELELEKVTGTMRAGDRFLLCSDGLWKALASSELVGLLTAAEEADRLIAAALAREASDNVTAVVVQAA